nr:hypothetical protein [uncultured Acetatifactor sp.]
MSVRFTERKMLFVLLLFSVLINNGFFHIINSTSKILDMLQMAVFVIAFMVILRMRNNNGKIVHDTKVSFLYSIYIVFFVGFQFFYCCIINHASVLEFAGNGGAAYIYVFYFPVILTYFFVESGTEKLLNKIAVITMILLTIVVVNTFFRNKIGESLLPFSYYTETLGTRNGRIRIWDLSVFMGIMAVYSFYKFFVARRRKDRGLSLYLLGLIFISVIYIEQTRMELLALLFTLTIMFMVQIKRKRIRMTIYIFGIPLFICCLFIYIPHSSLFQSFSTSGQYGLQTSVRIAGISYAIEQFISNPFTGYGMNLSDFVINHSGIQFLYSHKDIGIIGTLGRLGVFYFGVYIIPMIYYGGVLIGILKEVEKQYTRQEYSFLIGLYVYLLFTTISLLVTDSVRIYAWPFYLALFEFYRKRNICAYLRRLKAC